MSRQGETVQFHRLKQDGLFEKVRFSDRSVYWGDLEPSPLAIALLRLTLDNILFSLRDAE